MNVNKFEWLFAYNIDHGKEYCLTTWTFIDIFFYWKHVVKLYGHHQLGLIRKNLKVGCIHRNGHIFGARETRCQGFCL